MRVLFGLESAERHGHRSRSGCGNGCVAAPFRSIVPEKVLVVVGGGVVSMGIVVDTFVAAGRARQDKQGRNNQIVKETVKGGSPHVAPCVDRMARLARSYLTDRSGVKSCTSSCRRKDFRDERLCHCCLGGACDRCCAAVRSTAAPAKPAAPPTQAKPRRLPSRPSRHRRRPRNRRRRLRRPCRSRRARRSAYVNLQPIAQLSVEGKAANAKVRR